MTTPSVGSALRLTRLRLDGSRVNVIGDVPWHTDPVASLEVSVVAAGTRLYYGGAQTSEIRVYGMTGRLEAIVRSADEPERITDEEVEARLARSIPRNVGDAERAMRMERMRRLPHADTWPAYGRVHVDRSGRIWVADYRRSRDLPQGWSAFDASGRLLGRLVIPEQWLVIGFGSNDVLVRQFDEDRASHLLVYPIREIQPRRGGT